MNYDNNMMRKGRTFEQDKKEELKAYAMVQAAHEGNLYEFFTIDESGDAQPCVWDTSITSAKVSKFLDDITKGI